MKKTLIMMAVVALAFAGSAQAVPLYDLQVALGENHLGPAPGYFTVKATVSGDNFGLASYKITMTGWDALYQFSPKADITDGLFGTQAIGFETLRSANGSTPMTGAQPTVLGDPALLTYGIGQTATSLTVPSGWSITGTPTNNPFQQPVLLLVGTYSGGTPTVAQTGMGGVTRITVFTSDDAVDVVEADLIPEPATLALLGLGGLLALRRRR